MTMNLETQWKDIKGFDNYEISNEGNVRNKKTNRILKSYKNRITGYHQVILRKDNESYNKFVHRLVLQSFLPQEMDNTMNVVHIDTDKDNNNLSNLKWEKHSIIIKHHKDNNVDRTIDIITAELSKSLKQILNKYITESNEHN